MAINRILHNFLDQNEISYGFSQEMVEYPRAHLTP